MCSMYRFNSYVSTQIFRLYQTEMDDVNCFIHYIPYLSLLVFSTTLLVNSYLFILKY